MLLKWSFVQGLSEDIGADREEEEWTARRTAGGASSNIFFWKKKQHDFSTQFGPVESFYLFVLCIL